MSRPDRALTPAELNAFGAELDAIRDRVIGELGAKDTRYIRRVAAAVREFEDQLEHPALMRFIERAPGELFAATYRGVNASWYQSLKPRVEALGAQPGPPPIERVERLLNEADAFVEQLNTLVAVLEHDTETRIHDLRFILGVAIAVTLLVVIIALFLLHRALLQPLNGLLDAARRIAGASVSMRRRASGICWKSSRRRAWRGAR